MTQLSEDADNAADHVDKRSLEQNGDAASEVNGGRKFKNMFERKRGAHKMFEFFAEKFLLCRELFLTKTDVS